MPQSQLQRLWLIGGGLVAFVMILIGYFAFIAPQRSSTGDAQALVSQASSRNVSLQAHIRSLQEESKKLAQYQTELKQVELALPSTSGLPDFLRTLQSIGNATLANVSSLTVGPPKDVTGVASAAGASHTSSISGSKVRSDPSSAASAAAAVAAGGDEQQPTAAPTGGTHVYALPITAQVSGSVAQLDQFLTQLQSVQPRAVLITAITEGTGLADTTGSQSGRSSGTSLQLTMEAFVAPISSAEKAQLSAASGR